MSNASKTRFLWRALAASILLLLAVFFSVWWFTHPYWEFPVERLALVNGSPAFTPDDMIPEERFSVAHTVREKTWRPVSRVIGDDRFEQFGPRYAFVGSKRGRVFTLGSGGIDTVIITAESEWAGDPHAFVLQQRNSPNQSLHRTAPKVAVGERRRYAEGERA